MLDPVLALQKEMSRSKSTMNLVYEITCKVCGFHKNSVAHKRQKDKCSKSLQKMGFKR